MSKSNMTIGQEPNLVTQLKRLCKHGGTAFDPSMTIGEGRREVRRLNSLRRTMPMTPTQASELRALCVESGRVFDPALTAREAGRRRGELIEIIAAEQARATRG